jgi:hypothetical protein
MSDVAAAAIARVGIDLANARILVVGGFVEAVGARHHALGNRWHCDESATPIDAFDEGPGVKPPYRLTHKRSRELYIAAQLVAAGE